MRKLSKKETLERKKRINTKLAEVAAMMDSSTKNLQTLALDHQLKAFRSRQQKQTPATKQA